MWCSLGSTKSSYISYNSCNGCNSTPGEFQSVGLIRKYTVARTSQFYWTWLLGLRFRELQDFCWTINYETLYIILLVHWGFLRFTFIQSKVKPTKLDFVLLVFHWGQERTIEIRKKIATTTKQKQKKSKYLFYSHVKWRLVTHGHKYLCD